MSDRKYWRKRSVKLGLLSEQKAQRTARAVLDAYDRVLTTVQGRIERIFARFVRNNDSLNAEKARQLLSVRETQKYRQELLVLYHSTTDKALRDELRAMLEAPAYANRISRLEALRDIVWADCRQLGLLERELVGKGLADALQEAYTRQVFDIQQGTGYGRRIKTLEDKQVRAILGQKWRGGNFSGRIWNNNQAFADAVQQTILTGTLAGMSFREMSDMLLQITGTDATSGAKANSMRLIRTEFCHISAQGALLGYKSYDLEYYRYLATLDSQTDEECGALDMRRFPVKDARPGVNFPPMHPNCRCTTMPDMSEQVIAKIKRAARDPVTGKSITVPGDMSYAEWHKKFVQGVPDRKQVEQQRQRTVAYAHLAKKDVATAGRGGIIKRNRAMSKLNSDGTVSNPMDTTQYQRMKAELERQGYSVVAAKGDDARFLMLFGAEAISDEVGILHMGDIPSASAFFEEVIHYAQFKKYGAMTETDEIERAAREVAANRKLIKNAEAYRFTPEDRSDIERNLQVWEKRFERMRGVSYDQAGIGREI